MAEQLLKAFRSNPDMQEDAIIAECCRENANDNADEYEEVWRKLNTFPHIFEIANARGDLMDYDLNGIRREKSHVSIEHVSYRQWKVSLLEYDELLEKGILEPSTLELLMNFVRPHLPKEIFVKQPFALRSKKTSEDHLPKNVKPRVQVFPYRSNSQAWAFYLVTKHEDENTLQVITPTKYAAEAFDWATKQLKFQYNVTREITYLTWPSEQGSELLVVAGLLRALLPEANITRDQESSYVAEALSFLRELRNAAVDANESNLDVLLAEEPRLRTQAVQFIRTLVPASNVTADSYRDRERKSGPIIPQPKKLSALRKSDKKEDDHQSSGRIPEPTKRNLASTSPDGPAAPAAKVSRITPNPTLQHGPTQAVREVSRDPELPTLKRRRVPPVTPNVTKTIDTQTNLSAASNTKPSKSEPVIRDATEEETAAKRRALTEPEDIEEMGDMDARFPPENAREPVAREATEQGTAPTEN